MKTLLECHCDGDKYIILNSFYCLIVELDTKYYYKFIASDETVLTLTAVNVKPLDLVDIIIDLSLFINFAQTDMKLSCLYSVSSHC